MIGWRPSAGRISAGAWPFRVNEKAQLRVELRGEPGLLEARVPRGTPLAPEHDDTTVRPIDLALAVPAGAPAGNYPLQLTAELALHVGTAGTPSARVLTLGSPLGR